MSRRIQSANADAAGAIFEWERARLLSCERGSISTANCRAAPPIDERAIVLSLYSDPHPQQNHYTRLTLASHLPFTFLPMVNCRRRRLLINPLSCQRWLCCVQIKSTSQSFPSFVRIRNVRGYQYGACYVA